MCITLLEEIFFENDAAFIELDSSENLHTPITSDRCLVKDSAQPHIQQVRLSLLAGLFVLMAIAIALGVGLPNNVNGSKQDLFIYPRPCTIESSPFDKEFSS